MALRIQDDEILGVEAYAAELELLINGANQVPCSLEIAQQRKELL